MGQSEQLNPVIKKRAIIFCILISLAVIAVIAVYAALRSGNSSSPETENRILTRELEFQYLGSSWYDRVAGFPHRDFDNDLIFTWFEEVHYEEDMLRLVEMGNLTIIEELDYSEGSVVVSYNREIVDMSYCYEVLDPRNLAPFLILTFSEHHVPDTAYFYAIGGRGFAPGWIVTYCYILKDGNRIFVSHNIDGMTKTQSEFDMLFLNEAGNP